MKRIIVLLLSFAAVSSVAAQKSESDLSIEKFLKDFHANPKRVMHQLPSKIDLQGRMIFRGSIVDEQIHQSLEDRYEMRRHIIEGALPDFSFRALPDEKNNAASLLEPGPIISNLRDLENQRLTKSTLPVAPWDDSYWPIYKGLLADRYADGYFNDGKTWPEYYAYAQSRPALAIWQSGDAREIGQLSPAEKYDIAMGDSNFTLTNYSWGIGKERMEKVGSIQKWTGICHGWAGASHLNVPFPSEPVEVVTPEGRALTFYPADVKALQSMLWANASPPARFVGKRCDILKPPRDANGRVIDPRCFDTNPGTWHTVMTNQLGIRQKSFVMDGTYDVEVWNFPVYSYQYAYFNPQSLKTMRNLNGALVDIRNFSLDKFKSYRSPDVKFVAGIAMDVTYTVEINPSHRDPRPTPLMKTMRFMYDLELDDNMNIIGGEWYSTAHPDFLWTFATGLQAMAAGDSSLISDPWTVALPVPANWTGVAQRASSRGAPLFSFIRQLTVPTPPVLPRP